MRRLPAHSLLLLAGFVLGGLVGPALHRAEHAEERARALLAHVAEGHHHHGAAVRHGAEAAAPCSEPAAWGLLCVLCAGTTVYLSTTPTAVLAPTPRARAYVGPCEAAIAALAPRSSIRGPPEPVA